MTSWQDVIEFWFGELDENGLPSEDKISRWFKKDPQFDALITNRFGDLHAALLAGKNTDWSDTPPSAVAAVIVLDQFSRNMFRGTPGMFASDPLALSLTKAAIDRGFATEVAPAMETFFYMPLMHSESLEDQERCVDLFTTRAEQASGVIAAGFENNRIYAVKHRDIVARFGRFPHRNKNLGRTSTAEEIEFLSEPGSSF